MPLVRRDAAGPEPAEGERPQLGQGGPDERWAAARRLGAAAGDVAILAVALKTEPDPRVREAILTSLARVGNAESLAAVLPLLRSDAADLRTGALDALRAMAGAVAARLTDLLADPDPDVRLLACELARAIPAERAQQVLCDLIEQDAEVNVCAAAIEVLAEIGSGEAIPSLDRCARRFPNEAFLEFSIKVTVNRIAARPTSARG